jgi:hypothetical protein
VDINARLFLVGEWIISPLGKAQVRRKMDRYCVAVRLERTGQTVLFPPESLHPIPEVTDGNRPRKKTMGKGTT